MDVLDISRWFLRKSHKDKILFSNLKLQKMLYFSEAWHHVFYNKELFNENIEAWSKGPCVPSVYVAYNDLILSMKKKPTEKFGKKALKTLKEVYSSYKNIEDATLESMVQKDEPWIKAREGYSAEELCEQVIKKNKIKKFFIAKYFPPKK